MFINNVMYVTMYIFMFVYDRVHELQQKYQQEVARARAMEVKAEQIQTQSDERLQQHQRTQKKLQLFKDQQTSVLEIKKTLNEIAAEKEQLDKEKQRAVRRLTP